MSSPDQPGIRTRMFARVLGPFFVIVCATAGARTSEMSSLMSAFAANALWSWVAGSFVLAGGLVVAALHSYWRDPAAVVVSLMGWLITLRGVLLLAFPKAFISMANSVIGMGDLWRAICIGFTLIGLYLTYVGWMPASERSVPQAASGTPDLPRAA
ncbi:MAG TPA: hypothetical protein VMC78_23770 [Mycobacterium sp.]|nr:hypothetical protein [Mycobacterium sp.]